MMKELLVRISKLQEQLDEAKNELKNCRIGYNGLELIPEEFLINMNRIPMGKPHTTKELFVILNLSNGSFEILKAVVGRNGDDFVILGRFMKLIAGSTLNEKYIFVSGSNGGRSTYRLTLLED